ncbi:hypothetical protein [Streptomyces sp. NPDC050388]
MGDRRRQGTVCGRRGTALGPMLARALTARISTARPRKDASP